MMTDPLGDMLTRIRNACRAGHPSTSCPSSKLKLAVARVLKDEGYLEEVDLEVEEGRPQLRLEVRYRNPGISESNNYFKVRTTGQISVARTDQFGFAAGPSRPMSVYGAP